MVLDGTFDSFIIEGYKVNFRMIKIDTLKTASVKSATFFLELLHYLPF